MRRVAQAVVLSILSVPTFGGCGVFTNEPTVPISDIDVTDWGPPGGIDTSCYWWVCEFGGKGAPFVPKKTGCKYQAKAPGSFCDAHLPCAFGECSETATCVPIDFLDDQVCEDGNPCTVDKCDGGKCVGVLEDDGDPCTTAKCTKGQVQHVGIVVDDGNPCTVDSCDPVLGKQHKDEPAGTSCVDDDLCNGEQTCDGAGKCQDGTDISFDDGNPCTVDSCDPVLGKQHEDEPAGTSCVDDDLCNGEETCDGVGKCQDGTDISFDDDPCTLDSCDPATGDVTSTTPLCQ